MEQVVETSGLVKIYRSGRERVLALDGINFSVESGSITGLLGPNGAGKTTLFNILSGLLTPSSGSAQVLKMNVVKDSREIRRRIGLLPDGFGLYDTDTAEDNLRYIAALNDIRGDERERRIQEALLKVGLSDVKERKFGGFSRGMRQKLGVASLLVKEPEILILDEPTAGLDPEAAREFKDLMVALCREDGKTVVVSTHLLNEVAPLCTDVAIIQRGKIVLSGKVERLKKELLEKVGYQIVLEVKNSKELLDKIGKIEQIRDIKVEGSKIVVEASKDIREEISDIALRYSIRITSMSSTQPSLEDIFMKYYERSSA